MTILIHGENHKVRLGNLWRNPIKTRQAFFLHRRILLKMHSCNKGSTQLKTYRILKGSQEQLLFTLFCENILTAMQIGKVMIIHRTDLRSVFSILAFKLF